VALTAADPSAPGVLDEQRVEIYSQLVSGAAQSLANWWLDHPEVPRAVLVDRIVEFCWVGLERIRAGLVQR
jgi:hypothetical protein